MPASNHAPTNPILYSFASANAVVENLAEFILKAQFETIDKKGRFTLAISGGSLPKMLRDLYGPKSAQIEWEKWWVICVHL